MLHNGTWESYRTRNGAWTRWSGLRRYISILMIVASTLPSAIMHEEPLLLRIDDSISVTISSSVLVAVT
jgi:hypothetical protein